eukprot:TRINITY_DN2472_c0_g4_i1.p1 TRINITY_DN2472_c0_g4~~TRINITY_DN2472_c0_g4_i1.p1  ORF type:complete len:351 (+),score=102.84 TRINITY_DN2472_c0_g4_i1:209-1261(+)
MSYGEMSDKEKQQLVAEVNILRELRSPHVVRYYDRIVDKQKSKIYIVMEYCEGGDMGQLIKKCRRNSEHIAEDIVWKIFMQIALALEACHRRPSGKILHRDLKPGNILLDANTNVKLGDFGLSRIMTEDTQFASTHVGTPYYMSPEQIAEQRYNEKSDIWSAGCVMYEIAALKPPFQATSQLSLAIKIREGKFDRLPMRYSEELQGLLETMIRVNPEERPSIEDILKIPQIALRIREAKFKHSYKQLKARQDTLVQREKELEGEESKLREQQELLESKERELLQLENSGSSQKSSDSTSCSEHSPTVKEAASLLKGRLSKMHSFTTVRKFGNELSSNMRLKDVSFAHKFN